MFVIEAVLGTIGILALIRVAIEASKIKQPVPRYNSPYLRIRRKIRKKKNPLLEKIEVGVITNEENLENECSICLGEFDKISKRLNCGHSYHVACIEDWFKREYSCPMCREQF